MLGRSGVSAQDADGAFLLVEDAAQKGSPEAMMLLGRIYDPSASVSRGTVQPDAAQALIWYGRAASAGVPGAAEAVRSLQASGRQ